MRNILGPGLIFLVCLCVSLLINMPLTHVLAQFKLPNQIRLANIEGTLLAGRVDVLEVNRLQLTNLAYDSDLSCLLTLQWCYRVKFDQGDGILSASALEQDLSLTNTRVNYPMESLSTLFKQLLVKPSGDLMLDFDRISLKQQKVSINKGIVKWSHAGVVGEPFDLGAYQLTITSAKELYQLELKDDKAQLEVEGKGQLRSNGQYSININIKTRPGLNQQIKGVLDLVAKKRGLNQYRVQNTGVLDQKYANYLRFEDN